MVFILGVDTIANLTNSPHNTFIYLLHQFGIVGCLLWITFFGFFIYRALKGKKLKFFSLVPMIIVLVLGLEECLLYVSMCCILILPFGCIYDSDYTAEELSQYIQHKQGKRGN